LLRSRSIGKTPGSIAKSQFVKSDFVPVFLMPAEVRAIPGLTVPKGKTCTVRCPIGASREEVIKHLKTGGKFTAFETGRVVFVTPFGAVRPVELAHDASCSTCGDGIKLDHKPTPGRPIYRKDHGTHDSKF
jgi:hypothetical protein